MQDEAPRIEIRVERVSQLINTLDPFPFRERDLDTQAEDYIVGWARELPRHQRISIIVHMPEEEALSERAREIPETLQHFFLYRADVLDADLKELFRVGRYALAIGLAVLGLCLLLGQIVAGRLGPGFLGRFIEEGLIIVGWVANWRPIEIFLYDWWPLVRQRDLYRRLAAAEVKIKPRAGWRPEAGGPGAIVTAQPKAGDPDGA